MPLPPHLAITHPHSCRHFHASPQAPPLAALRSCWAQDGSSAGSGPAPADDYVFQKLVALFEGRPGSLSWPELVDLAQHAQLGDHFVLR